MGYSGLFVGLITLDVLYHIDRPPHPNQKIVASDSLVAAGGPATNAAIAFQSFHNPTKLLGVLGCHPIAQLVRSDLQQYGVEVADLWPDRPDPLPISSILVTQASGERAVVSRNAVNAQAQVAQIPAGILDQVEILLVDGHQMQVSLELVQQAHARQIPVVMDGGSWKPGFETLLPWIDYAICSANFYPPGCQTSEAVFAYLTRAGVSHLAITQGSQPILYQSGNHQGSLEVPTIAAVDTTGAGDVFHGAFCHFILQQPFVEALQSAAPIAASACQSFGTRHWLRDRR